MTMPYSKDDAADVKKMKEKLSKTYKSVSDTAVRQAIDVYNSVYDKSKDEGKAWASIYSVLDKRPLSKKKASPSARRVASRYHYAKRALYIPGDVTDDGWVPGAYAPGPVEGEGSQVPPARDSFGHELDDEHETESL